MDEREQLLPKWAQATIAELRKRVQYATEPLIKELAKLRPECERLRSANSAIMELLHCAAKGGHMTAHDVTTVLEGYDMQLVKE